jgi:hypothetical protein
LTPSASRLIEFTGDKCFDNRDLCRGKWTVTRSLVVSRWQVIAELKYSDIGKLNVEKTEGKPRT